MQIILSYPDKFNISEFKTVKFLSSGMYGMIYLVRKNNKEYALKIEHIFNQEVVENYTCPVWREIYFCYKFGNKYPELYLKLYGYDIVENYKYTHKYKIDIKFATEKDQEFYKSLHNSTTSIRKIYELIDYNYNTILQKKVMPQNMIYSMLVQILYSLILLHTNDYAHGDIHLGNIGVIKTNKKTIKLGNYIIPTYGYIYKLIDYGKSTHKLNIVNKSDFFKYINNDVNHFISILYSTNISAYIVEKNIDLNDFESNKQQINQLPEFIEITKKEQRNGIQMLMFSIQYPEKYQEISYKNDDKKVKFMNCIVLPNDLHIIEDIIDKIFVDNNIDGGNKLYEIIYHNDKKSPYFKELSLLKSIFKFFYKKLD
jgi:hypothetical protein